MNRYKTMFARLERGDELAFIPFTILGFPDAAKCLDLIDLFIENGADALELGIPFSDPIADGPVIQRVSTMTLAAGMTPAVCFEIIETVRRKHPHVPIGLLVYANLVIGPGPDRFFRACKKAGVDSVLVADVPLCERHVIGPAAKAHGIALVQILPPNASPRMIEEVASCSEAYVYLVARAGVTGAGEGAAARLRHLVRHLEGHGAAPAALGFGLRQPEDVGRAREAGGRAVISGSAILEILLKAPPGQSPPELSAFLKRMKKATQRQRLEAAV